jgi:hypothetical protein
MSEAEVGSRSADTIKFCFRRHFSADVRTGEESASMKSRPVRQSGPAGRCANVAVPTKGRSIQSGVLRLVLSVVTATCLPPTAEICLERPDSLIVQQVYPVR